MLNITTRRFLLILFIAAFLIRMAAVFALRNPTQFHGMQAGRDAVEFNAIALNIAKGAGYAIRAGNPTSFRAPGFPLFLAALYAISYANYALVYISLCILGAATCVAIFFLSRQLLTERQARISAMLAAVYFPAIYDCTVFMSETLFMFCITIGILAFIRYLRAGRLADAAISSIALGWSALTRPFAILLLPMFLGIMVLAAARDRKTRLASGLVFTLGFVGIIAPWTIRNYRVHHKFVLVATNGGSTFYGSNNDRVFREWKNLGGWVSTVSLPGRESIVAMPDEVSHDRMEWTLGKQWVRAHVLEMPLLCTFKLIRFWLPDISSGNRAFVILDAIGYGPFLVLFVLAFVQCVKNPQCRTLEWIPVHSLFVATLATALIFNGDPRYRDTMLPALLVYVGALWKRHLKQDLLTSSIKYRRTESPKTHVAAELQS